MQKKVQNAQQAVSIDETDRKLLRQLQKDATWSAERLAKQAGISKTATWNRIQKLQDSGVIRKQMVVVDPAAVGITETFFIAIKTNQHKESWLKNFNRTIQLWPEITEAHRLAGDIDYLLKVQVGSTREFDRLYKKLVAEVELYSVSSSLSMEVLKQDLIVPV